MDYDDVYYDDVYYESPGVYSYGSMARNPLTFSGIPAHVPGGNEEFELAFEHLNLSHASHPMSALELSMYMYPCGDWSTTTEDPPAYEEPWPLSTTELTDERWQVMAELEATTSPPSKQEKVSAGKAVYACHEPGCNTKPFGRSADLDRHTQMIHRDPQRKTYLCDYSRCSRHKDNPFYRYDHFRDHLRDHHKEDLLRRSVKPDKGWWASRSPAAIQRGWWRCSRCLTQRVDIATNGYSCPGCGKSCELERQEARREQRG